MLATDVVKIKYVTDGYLPNYPPHLISDEEMCEAFLTGTYRYFYDNYKIIGDNDELLSGYQALINAFRYHIARFLAPYKGWKSDLPDWSYSYMLGEVVTQKSIQQDKHEMLVGINLDNLDDEITEDIQIRCFEISKTWVKSIPKEEKLIKLESAILQYQKSLESKQYKTDEEIAGIIKDIRKSLKRWKVEVDSFGYVDFRPPSMFGEPYLMKLIRTNRAVV